MEINLTNKEELKYHSISESKANEFLKRGYRVFEYGFGYDYIIYDNNMNVVEELTTEEFISIMND